MEGTLSLRGVTFPRERDVEARENEVTGRWQAVESREPELTVGQRDRSRDQELTAGQNQGPRPLKVESRATDAKSRRLKVESGVAIGDEESRGQECRRPSRTRRLEGTRP